MCYDVGMNAPEKISWLTVLLVLWGSMYFSLLIPLSPAVAEVHDWEKLLMVILKIYEIATAVYLLALAFRLVYLRGKYGKRR